MRFPKQHQRKKAIAEFYKKYPSGWTVTFIEAFAIWKNFDELLCILTKKMFGHGCIKYDNGNLSSNFWIGFASCLSLNQMLPAALVFKHKMQLNLLLPWNSPPSIKWLVWQIAFQLTNGRFCENPQALQNSTSSDSDQILILKKNDGQNNYSYHFVKIDKFIYQLL